MTYFSSKQQFYFKLQGEVFGLFSIKQPYIDFRPFRESLGSVRCSPQWKSTCKELQPIEGNPSQYTFDFVQSRHHYVFCFSLFISSQSKIIILCHWLRKVTLPRSRASWYLRCELLKKLLVDAGFLHHCSCATCSVIGSSPSWPHAMFLGGDCYHFNVSVFKRLA